VKNIIISLFDHSGSWSKPYREAGYEVIQVDIKHGVDILTWDYKGIDRSRVYGILAAVPCTDFAVSGARWFKAKDESGETRRSIRLVEKTMLIINYFKPDFWVIENPVSRIHTLCPEIGKPLMYFNPCDFGETYTKKTALYGKFNTGLKKNPVEPTEGSKMWALYGGKSERTKELRSITPPGFSLAFFEANNNLNQLKEAV